MARVRRRGLLPNLNSRLFPSMLAAADFCQAVIEKDKTPPSAGCLSQSPRRSGVMTFARAAPPFLPSALAAGSLPSSGIMSSISPAASSNTRDVDGVTDHIGRALLAFWATRHDA